MSTQTTATPTPRHNRLLWYYRRLLSMPAAEIPHRIREAVCRQLWRRPALAARDLRLPTGGEARALPCLPLTIEHLAERIPADVREALRRDVDNISQGELKLLGQSWPPGSLTDWSLDPASGAHWHWDAYTFDIKRRELDGAGDVKLVWELSRLQHLQVLALGARILKDRAAATLAMEHLEHWIDNNPPYRGLGYACGIELASRIVSILAVITLLGPEAFSATLREKIWRTLVCHGRWIARFPSLYSSANNHLVAESAALYILGGLVPQLPDATRWRSTGWQRLANEAHRQILSDGGGAEQSPTYQAYTMEWMLLARLVSGNRDDFDVAPLDSALTRGGRFLSQISDCRGSRPAIGDCDEGVVIRPLLHETDYAASVVAATAAVLQRGDILHPAFTPDTRTLLYSASPTPVPSAVARSLTLPAAGYTVLRNTTNGLERMLMLDHGPLGFAETAAHGHADALSVWLHMDGHPILIDPGTYRYNRDGGWRPWLRGTAAHNTITIDHQPQSRMTGPFNWGTRAEARLREDNLSAGILIAEHTGYQVLGVSVHRRIVELNAHELAINDIIEGSGSHHVCSALHFAPDLHLVETGPLAFSLQRDATVLGTITMSAPGATAEVIRQSAPYRPGAGACAPAYNRLASSPSLRITTEAELPLHWTIQFHFQA